MSSFFKSSGSVDTGTLPQSNSDVSSDTENNTAVSSFFKTAGANSTDEATIQSSVDAAATSKTAAANSASAAADSASAAADSATAAAASASASSTFTTGGGNVGGNVDIAGSLTLSGNVNGRDLAADGTKLDGIEAGATADQTDAEIKTAYENNSDTNAFTDALQTKLNGIEASATADQTAAEIKTAYESNTDTNAFTDADHTKLDGIEASADVTDTTNVVAALTAGTNVSIAADGTISSTDTDTTYTNATTSTAGLMSATDKTKLDGVEASADVTDTTNVVAALTAGTNVTIASDGTISSTDTNTTYSNATTSADGLMSSTDKTKLDGIEGSADVTDTANVTAAGALMDSEVTNLSQIKSFDSSDYATAAQGTTADSALPKAGGTMTGNLELNNADIVFEGATDNTFETVLTPADPTADRTITLPDATGEVVLSDGNIDTDASAEIGRAHVGYVGHLDYAGFSHVDHNTSTNYSLLHSAAGNTFINGVSSINMRIGNASNTATVTSSALALGASKSLLFEGSTDDANETTITAKDPTADRTIYIPDQAGTLRVVERFNVTANLEVGWRTIAVLEGRDSRGLSNQRLTAKFTVADLSSGRHNLVTFTAQHAFGADNGLQVYGYSTYGTDAITNIRIKSSSLYGGAAIQIYVANATNNIVVFLDENNLENGFDDNGRVILKDGIADATDPGNVGYAAGSDEYSGFTEKARINLARIEHGGFATSNRLLVQDVDDGAGTGPFIDLYRQSESPADGDNLGTVRFVGHNDAGESLNYAEIRADAADVSDGTEDGKIFLYVKDAGADRLVTEFTSYGVQFHENVNIQSNKQLRFEGATADNFETAVIPTDPTADRTITLPDATGTVLLQDSSGDVTFTGDSYNVVWDKSDNALEFADNAKAVFGTGGDLKIWHSGSNSFIQESGTGDLYIQGGVVNVTDTSANLSAKFVDGGAVELYHNTAKKFETTSSGVTVTGDIISRHTNDATLKVHSDTATTPTAALELMRGTNDTYGADFYTDYRIINGYGSSGSAGGTLSIGRKVDGAAETFLVDFNTNTNLLTDVRFQKAIVEKAYNCTGTVLDPSNGTLQYKTLSANTTFTESFVDGESITLMIDDGSGYTVTWPGISWASGSAPTLATSGYTTIVLWHRGSLYGAVVS